MIDAPLAVAFGAGMLATVNPCGFAMLPAYLSYFLGEGEGQTNRSGTSPVPQMSVARALGVGAAVSAGFMTLFGVAGALLSWASIGVYSIGPWITLVIAAALIALGIAMLAGWEPSIALPHLEKGGKDRTFLSMYVFGISYAIASLGCTLPVFIATVSGTVRRHNAVSGLAVYVVYSLGMALILMTLTVAIATARVSLVRVMRGVLPYVSRVAGALVLASGLYIGWYGIVELSNLHGSGTATGGKSVRIVTGWSGTIANWVDSIGAVKIGLIFGLVLCLALFVSLVRAPRDE